MKSTKNLRLRLRLMEGALLLLLGVFTTAAVSTHQLLLDAANRPTSDFDLSGTHVVGILDPAHLPGTASFGGGVACDSLVTNQVLVEGTLQTDAGTFLDDSNHLTVATTSSDGGLITTDGNGNLTAASLSTTADAEVGALLCDSNLSSDQGLVFTDGNGHLTVFSGLNIENGNLNVNGNTVVYGDAQADFSTLAVDGPSALNGGFSTDSGVITTDGGGHLAVISLGLFGATPPASPPATPASLADVIAVLQAYGLCQ